MSTAVPSTTKASTSEAFRRVDSRAARRGGSTSRASPAAISEQPSSPVPLAGDEQSGGDPGQHDQVGHPGQPEGTGTFAIPGRPRLPGAGGPVAGRGPRRDGARQGVVADGRRRRYGI